MPTIYKAGKLRFAILFGDHNPPHVHVFGPGAEAKVSLDNCECYFARGFSVREISKIENVVSRYQEQFLELWHEYQN